MKKVFTTLFLAAMSLLTSYQNNTLTISQKMSYTMEEHFDKIKKDPHALRQFFWKMPKGGDIHHHFIGSVFAEDYLDIAIKEDLFINPQTYQLYFDKKDALDKKAQNAISIKSLLQADPTQREEVIDHWSVRNHQQKGRDGHHWFFATFEKFIPAVAGNEAQLLSELCRAAAEENLQYLETMVEVPSILERVARLTDDMNWQPKEDLDIQLTSWFDQLETKDIDHWAAYNAEVMDHWHQHANKHGVHLKFLTAAFRIFPNQATVFAHLMLAFKTAVLNEHVIGVNFVAPEDHQVSLANYELHMAMIRFLKIKYPVVNLSLHAGELVAYKGDTRDKDLTYHIDQAVTVAGAQRIGHGVDIEQEERKDYLLRLMEEKEIAVEVNLESNEVILEVNPETHPVKIYLDAGVPVCISSDDAGILRSDLTHQFELLVKYVPDISYQQIKTLVSNSIDFSFLNKHEKAELNFELTQSFKAFEHKILNQ